MKTKLTFLILIFFISLSSFTIFGNRDSNKRNSEFYEAKLVIKKESESSSFSSMFYNEYVPVKVEMDENNKIIKVSNLTTIKVDEILFSFVGEIVNFDKKNIALSKEISVYDEKTKKIQYFYLKIDKRILIKKI
ncbi:hypothetical protein M9Q43_03315 [Flavobacterium sp. HXWNR29]|jgi:hypothetical protein|uniref:hypothetical protein n=1 Tax=Flavobacterium odoriferum TaxID=2946604 RepID=UPI0021CB3183|nr:hypothetical protein [Flavobacterium sp. HXWNR29]MCU4188195.1 hypothetical protein [Flavobacterium sp. HXWNR29]